MKGTRYVILKRDFAEFVTKNAVAIQMFNWISDMLSGDESFFSTLITVQISSNGSAVQDLQANPFTNNQNQVDLFVTASKLHIIVDVVGV